MGERVTKCLKYFREISAPPHAVWCLQSLLGDAKLTASFSSKLETYLHIPKSTGKQPERAACRALLLLHILDTPDIEDPGMNWKKQKEDAWAAVDTLYKKFPDIVTGTKAEILYRFNNDQISWRAMKWVALKAAFQDIVTEYGGQMDTERRDAIKSYVESGMDLLFQEIPQATFKTKTGMILGLTSKSPVTSINPNWPRYIRLVRGVWDFRTVEHELMHMCCHDDFWTVALGGSRDPENPATTFHEGATEYLTRKIDTQPRPTKSYEVEVGTIEILIKQASGGGRMKAKGISEDRLIAAYFKGVDADLFQTY